jgi:hypothetical protein
MGLDMYLYARREVPEESHYLPRWAHYGEEKRATTDGILDLAGLLPLVGEESNSGHAGLDGSWVSITAAYWRKANHIHAWFVRECQGGVDECQETEIHPEKLVELYTSCQKAVAAYDAGDVDDAAAILPPQEGFFFGGTEVDEYYAEDLRYTIREIERIITAAASIGGVTFHYQSSW